jgi:shikimate kinase/3-dehydroquinate synthase
MELKEKVYDQSSVFLYGPSGSGKSTAGRILAQKLELPFVDLDLEIETQSGLPIPEIFSKLGESDFRLMETRVLKENLNERNVVIALGGGALTNQENQSLVESNGSVVLLWAPLETLLFRLENDSITRPLLAGDSNLRLQELLQQRSDHYGSFPYRVDTYNKSPDEVAWEIQVELGRFRIRGMASAITPGYDVLVQPGGLDFLGMFLLERGLRGPIAVVTDDNVGGFYLDRVMGSLSRAGYQSRSLVVPAGEEHKTIATINILWDFYVSTGVERSSTIIALGGGVIGDLVGFSAAAILRGVPWVGVPTSLLAMVDSSMGGKTGADLPQGKNLIGAFYPPRFVLSDPEVLLSLPEIEFANGMAEVIKHGVISDPKILVPCMNKKLTSKDPQINQVVRRGMAVKIKIIEEDPYEKGVRAGLNFGHTVGHGIELVSGYQLRHGEAVSIGMVVEAGFAEEIGLANHGFAEELSEILRAQNLPVIVPPGLDAEAVISAMKLDKKVSGGVVRYALPAAIGDVRIGIEVPGWEKMIKERLIRC